jgi:hypothetical protein
LELRRLERDLVSVPHLIELALPTLSEAAHRVIHRRKMLGKPHAQQTKTDSGLDRAFGEARRAIALEASEARASLITLFVRCMRAKWPAPLDLTEFVATVRLDIVAKPPRGRPRDDSQRGFLIAGEVFARRLTGRSYNDACAEVTDSRNEGGDGISGEQVRRMYRQYGREARLNSPEFVKWMNTQMHEHSEGD